MNHAHCTSATIHTPDPLFQDLCFCTSHSLLLSVITAVTARLATSPYKEHHENSYRYLRCEFVDMCEDHIGRERLPSYDWTSTVQLGVR